MSDGQVAGGGASGVGGAGAAGGAAAGAGGGGAPPAGGAHAGGDQPFYSGWDGLDDAGRDFLTGKGFKTPADLLKSAMLSDKLVRDRNVIAAPDPKALDQWDGWSKLGWTSDAAQYKLGEAKVPDGLERNEAVEAEFAKIAHGAKLPPHQAAAMRDGLLAMMKAQQDARDSAGAAEAQRLNLGLRNEWGRDYDAKVDEARRAALALGVDLETAGALEKFTGAAGLVKMFQRIGESLGEDVLRGGASRSAGGQAMTSEQAASEQRRLAADKDFMASMANPRHPQHQDNQARWQRLIETKVGGQRR